MQPLFDRPRHGFSFGDDSFGADSFGGAGDAYGVAAARRGWFFLAGAALVLLLFARPLYFELGAFDLENDEAIYSHAVLSVAQQGAWLSPWSSPFTGPFLEKPPLKIWLVALGQLAGLPADELGLRFFDPLLGALALLYLYALGFRAGGALAGVAAAGCLFLFEPLVFEHGLRSNNMESALLLAYCGGAWHCLEWRRSRPGSPRSRRQLIAATLFFTFGFLVKFVAALFLPLAAAAAALLAGETRRRLWRERGLLLAAGALFALLAAPWFVCQHFANGALFWRVILGQHVVERFTGHLDATHLQPFGFYFLAIARQLEAGGTLPWVLAGLALWLAASWRERSFFGAFVLLWAFLPLLAISFGTSKLLHYAYPFLPPFALFAGFAVAKLAQAVGGLARAAGLRSSPPCPPLRPGELSDGLRPRQLDENPPFRPREGRGEAPPTLGSPPSPSAERGAGGRGPLLFSVQGGEPSRGLRWGFGAAGLAVLILGLLLAAKPVARYGEVVARLGAGGERMLHDLAVCLGQDRARTLVDAGKSRPLVFVHAFLTDGIFHPLAFYSRRGAELQQLAKPDEKLLFFRLYLPPHQAATVVPEILWQSFRDNLADPAFREGLLAQARDLGAEPEVARLLADPDGLPEPPGFTVAGQRYFLPGPYAACLPP